MALRLLMAAVALAAATPAFAQPPVDDEGAFDPAADPTAGETFDASGEGPVRVSGDVTFVTDYRDRGLSQTGERPALQGSVRIEHESGLYAVLWASTQSRNPIEGDYELNPAIGFRMAIGSGTELDLGVEYELFPDRAAGVDTDYVETYASLSHTLGPVTARFGAAYAPAQEAIGDADNLYVTGELIGGIPGTSVTLSALVGYSNGSMVPVGDNYLNWRIGADVVQGPFTIGLAYIDTDLPNAPHVDAALVLTARFGF